MRSSYDYLMCHVRTLDYNTYVTCCTQNVIIYSLVSPQRLSILFSKARKSSTFCPHYFVQSQKIHLTYLTLRNSISFNNKLAISLSKR